LKFNRRVAEWSALPTGNLGVSGSFPAEVKFPKSQFNFLIFFG